MVDTQTPPRAYRFRDTYCYTVPDTYGTSCRGGSTQRSMLDRGIRALGCQRIESTARVYLQNASRWRSSVWTMLRIQPGAMFVNLSSSSTDEWFGARLR